MKAIKLYCIVLSSSLMLGCLGNASNTDAQTQHPNYDLEKPDDVYALPGILKEVSGISLVDKRTIACVQDERGMLFLFDLETRRLKKEFSFWKKGDYEDLKVIGKDCYVVKSNGTIYRLKKFNSDKMEVEKFPTDLCKKNDVEGLEYDEFSGSLWLACKGASKICEEGGHHKAIYAFKLKDESLSKNPVVRFDLEDIAKRAKKKVIKDFSPSALAIHPITNEIYILSSVGRQMLVFTHDWLFKKHYDLTYSGMKQPEGICFNEKGDLYISNEGHGSGANILFYQYH